MNQVGDGPLGTISVGLPNASKQGSHPNFPLLFRQLGRLRLKNNGTIAANSTYRIIVAGGAEVAVVALVAVFKVRDPIKAPEGVSLFLLPYCDVAAP